jgi:hypothetical protein
MDCMHWLWFVTGQEAEFLLRALTIDTITSPVGPGMTTAPAMQKKQMDARIQADARGVCNDNELYKG